MIGTKMRRGAVVLLLIAGGVFAQTWQWPAYFGVPQPPDSERADSTARFRLETKNKVFENDENTTTGLLWTPPVQKGTLQQHCTFVTSGDVGLDVFNEFSDLSGRYLRDSVLPAKGALGLEWIPTIRYNRHDSLLAFQTLADLGPVMQWRIASMPLALRGGLSGTGWNENLQPGLHIPRFSGTASGYYGGFSLGDPTRDLFTLPLHIDIQALGRSIRKDSASDGIAVLTGSALLAHKIGDGDSVFGYYGDSLSNGKEEYWGASASGRQRYMSTPWRIARSMQTAFGIKGRERLGFVPAVLYSFTDNSVEYPNNNQVSSDVRDRLNNFNFLLSSDSAKSVFYRGGLKISYGSEVWMFTKDSLSVSDISAKLNDHQMYLAASDHYLGLRLPHDFLIEYKLTALRDSKTYDTIEHQTNSESNDRITINHHLGLVLGGEHAWTGNVFGEYSIYTLNYLSGRYSSQNSTMDGYRVGAEAKFQPSSRLVLDETVVANAEVIDYEWKDTTGATLPPYDRRITSDFRGSWRFQPSWELSFRSTETYFDNGVWYGHEYFSARDTARHDYYGIGRFTWDHSGEAGIALVKQNSRTELGCKIQNTMNWQYVDTLRSYLMVRSGHDVLVSPYLTVKMEYRRLSLRGTIARRIYTVENDSWNSGKFWDIAVVGQAAW